MMDKKNSPESESAAYAAMSPRIAIINTLLGGTEKMRAAGEEYLPRHAEEAQASYDERLAAAVLYNVVEQTLDTLAARPFVSAVVKGDNIPAQIKERVLFDVDLQGNSLDVFARNWFRDGMAKALSHVLVEYPRITKENRTAADDTADNLRPYLVHVMPENLIYARAEYINGRETLTHVRIKECSYEPDGYGEREVERIRVLEPGHVTLLEEVEDSEEWRVVDEWDTELQYIPLVTFYAHKTGLMEGKPPLLDLAYLNIAHWQSYSDQRNILAVSRFPMLARKQGFSTDESTRVKIGPRQYLQGGEWYYVEHSGAAIASGREDLKDLETQMNGYGAEFLKENPGGQTATARALDSAEATSDLQAMVLMFEDAMAQVLDIVADWMRLPDGGGTISLSKEFSKAATQQPTIDMLKFLREKRDISRATLLSLVKDSGILPSDFDEEADLESLMSEMGAEMGIATQELDPTPTV